MKLRLMMLMRNELDYQLFMPILLTYLNDADVLKRLLLTGKAIKPVLINYPLKSDLSCRNALNIIGWHRYLPVRIVSLTEVDDYDLHAFTSLTSLCFSDEFNGCVRPGMIPLSVKRIRLGHEYDQAIPINALPLGLEYLHLGMEYAEPIAPGVLPDSITELELSMLFDHPLTADMMPRSLRTLKFNGPCSHKIVAGALPQSLTRVHFDSFNEPFEIGSLPSSLRYLTLSDEFDQDLDKSIMPVSLLYLELCSRFSSRLFLPSTLISLCLWTNLMDITFINPFPTSLTSLILMRDSTEPLAPGVLPNTLIHLYIRQTFLIGSIPDSVIELTYSNQAEIPPNAIPNSVRTLWLTRYNQLLWPGVIPSSVTHLNLLSFNQILLPGSLPKSIVHLQIGDEFDQLLIPGVLPEGLISLSLTCNGGRFDKPLFSSPCCCKHRCESHQSDLMYSLPRSLTHLCLSEQFNQPLHPDSLPPHLTHLALGERFTQPLSTNLLPASLKELVVPPQSTLDLTNVHCKIRRIKPEVDVDWMPKLKLLVPPIM